MMERHCAPLTAGFDSCQLLNQGACSAGGNASIVMAMLFNREEMMVGYSTLARIWTQERVAGRSRKDCCRRKIEVTFSSQLLPLQVGESEAFGKSFRLVRAESGPGLSEFTPEMCCRS